MGAKCPRYALDSKHIFQGVLVLRGKYLRIVGVEVQPLGGGRRFSVFNKRDGVLDN